MVERGKLFARAKQKIFLVITVLILCNVFAVNVFATGKTDVTGKVYEFEKDSHYEFSKQKKYLNTQSENTYGSFSVSGNITDVKTKKGVPAYEVTDGDLKIYYDYGDEKLHAVLDSWHVIEDKSKTIDGSKINSKIKKGTIIVQTSIDRMNWIDEVCITDAFQKSPIRTKSIYKTKDVQLINGCYYRVIVAYELRKRIKDSNILFINNDKFKYKKCAEVYEFYAYSNSENENIESVDKEHKLGKRIRVKDFDTYSGKETIKKEDPHYNWDIGTFFVNGYTDKIKRTDGDMIFLKNVGDKVTLWFRLNQDINKIQGKKELKVTADEEGSDLYFETPTMNFGRGTLIIRHTDYNNNKSKPIIYTNYLEANTSVGSDTKVQLFEEGDYEVALDYEITNDQLIDKIGHYRIFFKFSVRNGNCMVYPFDATTGSELTNSSVSENGFKLDLAKSRYLKVNLKREMLAEGADGLIEDMRFNGPAEEGAEYTENGIYTITATNEYTGQFTVKKIYVGTNKVLKAHMTTGLSVSEINKLVEQGAIIDEDGNIQLKKMEQNFSDSEDDKSDELNQSDDEKTTIDDKKNSKGLQIILVISAVFIISVMVVFVLKRKQIKKVINNKKDNQGGED